MIEDKRKLLMGCECIEELNAMWDHLPQGMKDNAEIKRAYDQRKSDLTRAQREAA
jgi:hypothetical protein